MRRSLLPLALATILLAACGAEGTTSPDPGAAVTAAATTALPAASAPGTPAALGFTAPLVGGGTLDFSEFAGTTVALWFWAPT